MNSSKLKGARCGLVALGAGLLLAAAPAGGQVATPESAGDALSRNLRSLAQNPQSVSALMGAGKAALELGDAQAAITLFARAESVDPKNGRIKMWIGSALVQLQQPRSAFKFFQDAIDLGVPEAELAGERGLAWDISGEPRRAQSDYRLVLRRGRDAEVIRRLALSLAISGEREPALRLLEEQLLVGDPAGQRTRALVLALTGDTAGANRAVEATMPGGQGAAMAPFLARLPGLTPGERASAVHLGQFPGDARNRPIESYASNQVAPPPATDAGRPDTGQAALGRPRIVAPNSATTPARRADTGQQAAATPRTTAPSTQPTRTATRPRALPGEFWTRQTTTTTAPRRTTTNATPAPAPSAPAPAASQPEATSASPTRPSAERVAGPVDDRPPASGPATPSPSIPTIVASNELEAGGLAAQPEPAPAEMQTAVQLADLEPSSVAVAGSALDVSDNGPAEEPGLAEATPAPAAESARGSRLADVAAAIAALPDPEPATPPAAQRTKPPAAAKGTKTAAATPVKKPAPAPPREASRHWVQIAGGANKAFLPREYGRLKAKAPKLLGARKAWTVPANATNRLLVGPFASAKEAQLFVNELAKADVGAFAWTSEAGQKIDPLPPK